MPPKSKFSAEVNAAQSALAAAVVDGRPDYERIRQMVDAVVPFNNHVGVRVTELGPTEAVAEVADLPTMRNHLGTVHAGAMWLAAEVACAAAFSGAVATRIAAVQSFVLRESKVSFLRPATGRVRATGTVEAAVCSRIVAETTAERYEMTGKALLHDGSGTLVGKVDFDYVCWMKAN
ncbi:YiiD C-terminal domain-containing protein [Actinokineospora auranticolor]|uniref:Acyl-coenzyme A thioesterase PaaI-like protein n=1 Tax=Actinokineospora auranticolor TaxID=155976 RepID=A0A2S6GIB8_9PSEU|nr:DUF4442 domain-containing protein [Actinokineospora auranticolor]PPK64906.1 acyl-coenzyme A thioesterase PaaI-like protein [Actinokineospora auranticolor]